MALNQLIADLEELKNAEDATVSIPAKRRRLHPRDGAPEKVPPDSVPEPTPESPVPSPFIRRAKIVYMIKIFEEGSGASTLFESDFHWGLEKDAAAALQELKQWYDRHTTLQVEGRLFYDTMIRVDDAPWERKGNVVEVILSSSSSGSANPTPECRGVKSQAAKRAAKEGACCSESAPAKGYY